MSRALSTRQVGGGLLLLLTSLGCPSGDPNGPGPTPPTVDRVTVSPAVVDLLVGAQQGLSATALAADGTPIPGKAAAWSSNNTTAATVNATTGLVTAVGAGSAVIMAVIDGRTGQATVQVTLPPQPLAVVTAGTGTGTVTTSPDGITCARAGGASSGTCNTTYPADTPITLQAVAAEGGHTFQGWSGEGCSGTGPCQVVMSQARTVTATFAAPHQLTITTAGGGNGSVASAPAGIACSRTAGTEAGTCTLPLPEGTLITLTATAAVGHAFTGWTGGGCSGTAPCQVTMTEARTVTATFVQTPALTVVMAGTGSGMVISAPVGIACGSVNGAPSGACSAPFPAGAAVTLTAQGTAGGTFVGWTGEGCSGTGPCQVQVTQARTVTATFMLPVTLTVQTAGDGDGIITSSPAGISCARSEGAQSGLCSAEMPAGSVVTLTANPAEEHALTGWSGAPCPGTGPCHVQMNGPQTVTGTFARQLVPLSVTLSGDGTGTVTSTPEGLSCGLLDGVPSGVCEWMVAPGTVVTLTPQTSPGFGFSGWTGGGCTGTGACTLTVGGPTQVGGGFLELRAALTVITAGQGSGTVTSTPAGIACTRTNGSQSGACQTSVRLFERVSLTALPAAGHIFVGWSGGACSGDATCEVTMSAATAVTATFTPAPELLIVTTEGIGSGSVSSAPAGIACIRASEVESGSCVAPVPYGTTVTLTAAGSGGHEFTGWTGGGCSGTGTCQVSMTQAREVRAAFTIPLGIGFGPEQWVDIPAGTYVRGSWSGTFDNQPPHTVTLTQPFRMLKTEITWAQYQQVVAGTNPGTIPEALRRIAMRNVDMDDIRFTFLQELNRIDPGKGYRLPTEAEWEYAARAGDVADAPANLDAQAWHSLAPDDGPKVVAMKLPNARGLYDMLGNVAEWVQDYWNNYPSGSVTDPIGGSVSGGHPVRGGSYSVGVPNYYRRPAQADHQEESWLGFRIVASGGGTYTLTVSVGGTGSGRITSVAGEIDCVLSNGTQSGDCSHTGAAGTSLGLFSQSGSGSTFRGWSGGGCGAGGSCTVLLNQDLTVTAKFDAPFTLTLLGAGSGQGRVTSQPAGIDCYLIGHGVTSGACTAVFPPGTAITLYATTSTGQGSPSLFTGWAGGLGSCAGPANPCYFSLNSDQTTTATFALRATVELRSMYANGNGTVTAAGTSLNCRTEALATEHKVSGTCSVHVPVGTTLTLTPNPAPGGHWYTWDPDSPCGTASFTCTLTVSESMTIGFAFWHPCVEFVPGGPVTMERSVTINAAGPCFWYTWTSNAFQRQTGSVFLVYQTDAARVYTEHTSSAPLAVGVLSPRGALNFPPQTTRTGGAHEDFLLGPGLHVVRVLLPPSSGSSASATIRVARLANPAANRCLYTVSPPIVESAQSLGQGDCLTPPTTYRDYYYVPGIIGLPVSVTVEGLGIGLILEQLDATGTVIASASAAPDSPVTLTTIASTTVGRFRVRATLPQGVSGPYRLRVDGSGKLYR